jgi:hypothetical protein
LKINLKTAHADVIALRVQGGLPGEHAVFKMMRKRGGSRGTRMCRRAG